MLNTSNTLCNICMQSWRWWGGGSGSPRPAPRTEAEGEEGVGLQQTEAPGQRHSLVMQLAGEPKRSLTSCHMPYHIFCPKGGQVCSHPYHSMWTIPLHLSCSGCTFTGLPSKHCVPTPIKMQQKYCSSWTETVTRPITAPLVLLKSNVWLWTWNFGCSIVNSLFWCTCCIFANCAQCAFNFCFCHIL